MTSIASALRPTLVAACLTLLGAEAAPGALMAPLSAQWHTAFCDVTPYSYLLWTPAGTERRATMLLLHGSGGQPGPMIDAWASLAKREQLVLIAPQLPEVPSFEPRAPAVFECLVGDAARFAPIDSSRIYLFGHSMGGYLAYDAVTLASDFFAGAAVHAMDISPAYTWIVDSARNHLPIAIYIGDHDSLISLARVRRTRDLLTSRGFPLHYLELRNHDHDYWAVADQVNRDAWTFLRSYRRKP